ncbi:hypothetical protein Trydic_g10116 [Trypoxylus dichotomus]
MSTMNVSSSEKDIIFDSDTESPDENDTVSECGDSKRYKVILHNVNEEWIDGLQDVQKAKLFQPRGDL